MTTESILFELMQIKNALAEGLDSETADRQQVGEDAYEAIRGLMEQIRTNR